MSVFNLEDSWAILAAAEQSPFLDVFRLAFATGVRRSEALALKWRDVDLTARTITINGRLHRLPKLGLKVLPTKTEKSNRTIDLSQDTVDMLESRKLEAADTQDGTRVAALVLKPVHCTMRATVWLRGSSETERDPQQVAALLDHSTAATTFKYYSHALRGRGRQTAERLTNLRNGRLAGE